MPEEQRSQRQTNRRVAQTIKPQLILNLNLKCKTSGRGVLPHLCRTSRDPVLLSAGVEGVVSHTPPHSSSSSSSSILIPLSPSSRDPSSPRDRRVWLPPRLGPWLGLEGKLCARVRLRRNRFPREEYKHIFYILFTFLFLTVPTVPTVPTWGCRGPWRCGRGWTGSWAETCLPGWGDFWTRATGGNRPDPAARAPSTAEEEEGDDGRTVKYHSVKSVWRTAETRFNWFREVWGNLAVFNVSISIKFEDAAHEHFLFIVVTENYIENI